MNCPICNSYYVKKALYPGYFYMDKKYRKYECKNCHFIFMNQIPDKKILERIYNSKEYFNNYYVLNSDKLGYLGSRDIAIKNSKRTLKYISKYAKGDKLLEIGCAGGFFLLAAQSAGFKVKGIELSKEISEKANIFLKGNIINTDIMEFKNEDGLFDVIYMSDVLEHLPDLNIVIEKINHLLTNEGILVIEGPITYNKTFFNFFLKIKFFLRRKDFYSTNAPTHLWEFSPKNLKVFLKNNNFNIIFSKIWEKSPSLPLENRFLTKCLKSLSCSFSNSVIGRFFKLGDRTLIISEK